MVSFEEARGVVHGDRPEAVNRHISHGQFVIAGDAAGIDADVTRFAVWQTTPTRGGRDEVPNRVDLVSGAEGVIEFADVLGQFHHRVACRVEA
jgi:hypothetical protein